MCVEVRRCVDSFITGDINCFDLSGRGSAQIYFSIFSGLNKEKH